MLERPETAPQTPLADRVGQPPDAQRESAFQRLLSVLRRLLIPVVMVAGVSTVVWLVFQGAFSVQAVEETLVHRVARNTLDDTVVERGTIESQNTATENATWLGMKPALPSSFPKVLL